MYYKSSPTSPKIQALDKNSLTRVAKGTAASDLNQTIPETDQSPSVSITNDLAFASVGEDLNFPGLSEADLMELTEDLERLIDPEFLWTTKSCSELTSSSHMNSNDQANNNYGRLMEQETNSFTGEKDVDDLPFGRKTCQSPWSSPRSGLDSDYCSNPSPLNNNSGLFSDTNFGSLYDSHWEESYTDLFPSLM